MLSLGSLERRHSGPRQHYAGEIMFKQLVGQFYLLSELQPLFSWFSERPVVRLSCQARIERQMFSAFPTPLATPSSLNAACTGQLGNKRLLYLIFLGKGTVGSGGFKGKAPNCNEMGRASRQGRLPSKSNDCPQQSSVLSFVVVLHQAL